ncbi:MAG: F420-nonreducing hydrogenase [Deltaproteobacteria bacterium]|nr:MAG: F420-nonreducing hydrogenase [Deltaproteobacteria bacterium]
MPDEQDFTLALFYCQRIPGSSQADRVRLEEKYGKRIRFFPIPCSGRLEPVHLLKALEEFADAACVITCPEGACRYFEGNLRAKKRVAHTRTILESIGLEPERVDIVVSSAESLKPLDDLAESVLGTASRLGPSPVHRSV